MQLYELFPGNERIIVDVLRQIIIETLPPEYKEKISYNVPFFYGNRGICIVWPATIPGGGIKEGVLFNRNIYHNNPMKIHLEMQTKTPLLKHHFDTWLGYFNTTVDEMFEGSVASKAKERALSIATVMQIKISQQKS